jgi:hypothetical protein
MVRGRSRLLRYRHEPADGRNRLRAVSTELRLRQRPSLEDGSRISCSSPSGRAGMVAPRSRSPKPNDSRARILERIEREAGVPALTATLAERISPTDLQSLLLEVYARRAQSRTVADVLHDYRSGRFVRPSTTPPARMLSWDALAWKLLPDGFAGLELAPVAPLGTVSRLAPLSQDWSVSTSRNSEVVSDCTTALALECAVRRAALLEKDPGSTDRVHLAASHRLLRGQKFGEGPGVRQHFRLFGLCSAGRDTGASAFETEVAGLHVRFFVAGLRKFLGPSVSLRVALASLAVSSHLERIRRRLLDPLRSSLAGVPVDWEDPTPEGRAYYRSLRFHIYAKDAARPEVQLVDGGDVDWGQRLLSNGKERMITSGLGTERLCEVFGPGPSAPG